MKKKYSLFILYLLFFLYFEIISKILMFNKLPDLKFIFILFFSITYSLFLFFVNQFGKIKTQKKMTCIFVFLLTIFYIFNYLYFTMFSVPFSVSTLELASQAMDFTEIGFHLVLTKCIEVLLFLIPLISYFLYKNKIYYEENNKKRKGIFLLVTIINYCVSILILNFDKKDTYSSYNLYYKIDSLTMTNEALGIFTTQQLSLKRNLFGFKEDLVQSKKSQEQNKEKQYNEINIDFANLIANESDPNIKNTYQFLQNQKPTNKNEYTGIYKGKNLIFILAEGFNSIAVSPELTPTLYKLIQEGFHFTNYYSPVFLSTTGGEFQAMTSLIPTQEILGMWRNNNPYLPYALGNIFGKQNYHTASYHNWSYKYYGRNNTMPTLGFHKFKACGNGLETTINCKWLPSDVDLINESFDEYKNNQPFVTYYITVSGHAPYNFTGGNSIALKNKELVENLPYSNAVKAYIASQLELEKAVSTLITKLKENNLLDDTVLVLTGDHYPYTLTLDEINEISEYERDEIVEVNHSNLIIWNNKKENKTIDKVASQIDVLPTILNLFGMDYDSRLFIGNDIFSDEEGLAIFSNRSWISDQGTYITNQGFTSKNGKMVDNNYIEEKNSWVQNSFTLSKDIIENDLYRKIVESQE